MKNRKLTGSIAAFLLVGAVSVAGAIQIGASEVPSEESVQEETAETEGVDEGPGLDVEITDMPDDSIIAEGIFIGDFDLGGKSKEEARQMIEEYVESYQGKEVVLSISGNQEPTTAGALGYQWTNSEALDEAAVLGTKGNLISRYKVLKDLETEKYYIEFQTTFDDNAITSFVNERSHKYDAEAKNATLTRSGGKFVVTNEVVGRVTDIEMTMNSLKEALKNDTGTDQLVVEATVLETQPSRTAAALSQVQNSLGSYSTNYSTGNVGRSKNLSVAAGKIDGIVLMPGEQFSGYEAMAPFTTSNGYAAAGSYENGMLVESVGGGACQITTTLYNAAMLAEMEITQRQNHSMIVGYVPYSQDAAIAGTYKDLKFKNNTDYPVYIACSAGGGTLSFTIYGKETRPANRTIKYQSVTISENWPDSAVITEDPNLPEGTQITEQGPYPGISSQLWKYVYINGQQTEKILVHQDRYSMSAARITVGTGSAAAVDGPAEAGEPGDAPEVVNPPVEGGEEDPAPGEDIVLSDSGEATAPAEE